MNIWFGLLVAPLLALADQVVSYATVDWACSHGSAAALHAVHASFLAATALGTIAAWRLGSGVRRGTARDEAVAQRRFLAALALALGCVLRAGDRRRCGCRHGSSNHARTDRLQSLLVLPAPALAHHGGAAAHSAFAPWLVALLAASGIGYAAGVAALWRKAGAGRGIRHRRGRLLRGRMDRPGRQRCSRRSTRSRSARSPCTWSSTRC